MLKNAKTCGQGTAVSFADQWHLSDETYSLLKIITTIQFLQFMNPFMILMNNGITLATSSSCVRGFPVARDRSIKLDPKSKILELPLL